MKRLGKWILQVIISLIGILIISGLPMFIMGLQEKKILFAETVDNVFQSFSHLWTLNYTYVVPDFWGRPAKEYAFFPKIWGYIHYSWEILFLALIAAVFFAIAGTFLTMLFKEKTRQRIKMTFYFLEVFPDILVIMLAQLAVVFIFKQTGVLISKVAVIQEEKIYWLPIFCLMILPMIQLYRLSMLTFEAEERQMYKEFARSLGFGRLFILFFHLFQNAIISVFFQSKKTMWFMLSNLFVLEYFFNMPGIMNFLATNLTTEIFLLTVLSFFIPVFIIYSIGEWYFLRRVNKGGMDA